MKALWKCEYEKSIAEEPIQTLIMESEDVDLLKQKGYEIAQDKKSPDSWWVHGPNEMRQYQMELSDGSILTIR